MSHSSSQRRRMGVIASITSLLLMVSSAAMADVWTDKADYEPGSVVTIQGDGMWPDEAVQVGVFFPDGSLAQSNLVQADASGNFTDTYLLPGYDAPVVGTYTVEAFGLSSGNGFTTTFEDGHHTEIFIPDGTTDTYTGSTRYSLGTLQRGETKTFDIHVWFHGVTSPSSHAGSSADVTLSLDGSAGATVAGWTGSGFSNSSLTGVGPGSTTHAATGGQTVTVTIKPPCTLDISETTTYDVDLKADGSIGSDGTGKIRFLVSTAQHSSCSTPPSNNAPDITSATFNPDPVNCQNSTTLTVEFNDSDSTSWTAAIDWEYDGTTFTPDSPDDAFSVSPPSFTRSHTYATPGNYTARVRVTDNQGASDFENATVVVNQTYTATWYQPIDPATNTLNSVMVNKTKLGRVVPLKVSLVDDCTGNAVNGSSGKDVSLRVYEDGVPGTSVLTDAIEQYVDAGQANNNTFCFRWNTDGSFWLHNFDTSNKGNFGSLQVGKTYRAEVGVADDAGADGIGTCTRAGRVYSDPDALLKMMK